MREYIIYFYNFQTYFIFSKIFYTGSANREKVLKTHSFNGKKVNDSLQTFPISCKIKQSL